jgi:hypothetical protein
LDAFDKENDLIIEERRLLREKNVAEEDKILMVRYVLTRDNVDDRIKLLVTEHWWWDKVATEQTSSLLKKGYCLEERILLWRRGRCWGVEDVVVERKMLFWEDRMVWWRREYFLD